MTSPAGYSRAQITLHWLTALAVLGAWITHDDMDDALKSRIDTGVTGIEGNTLHVWFGITVFALVALRLVLRRVQGAPGPVAGLTPAMELAAAWGHRALYALALAVPALGMAAWFGHLRELGDLHESLAQALMLLALGHAVVALWHQYVRRDGTLTRMVRAKG